MILSGLNFWNIAAWNSGTGYEIFFWIFASINRQIRSKTYCQIRKKMLEIAKNYIHIFCNYVEVYFKFNDLNYESARIPLFFINRMGEEIGLVFRFCKKQPLEKSFFLHLLSKAKKSLCKRPLWANFNPSCWKDFHSNNEPWVCRFLTLLLNSMGHGATRGQ